MVRVKADIKPVVKSFQATLERGTSNLNWVIIAIPFDAAKLWGTRAQIRVKGDINGFPFRTSLFPTGNGGHTMLVNKKMQAGGKARVGSTAKFRLERDTEERVVNVPPELESFLAEDRAFRRWFDQLTPSIRYDVCRRITEVKNSETRARRADQLAEQMLAVMDAERDPPPILKAVFARDSLAREGWDRMPPSHRRHQLFGIFHYRTPESRGRRVAKLVQEAYKYAEKSKKSDRPITARARLRHTSDRRPRRRPTTR